MKWKNDEGQKNATFSGIKAVRVGQNGINT